MSILNRINLFTCLTVAFWLTVSGAQAHESRPAYQQINETAPAQSELLWRTPMLGTTPLAVVLQAPQSARNIRKPIISILSDSRLKRRWIDAGPDGLSDTVFGFPGLEVTTTEAIVKAEFLDGRSWMSIAGLGQPWVRIEPNRSGLQGFGDFLRQGFDHILSGFDHLLFVFGLLLLVPIPWMLVRTIAAFTLGHSITLGAATLGYVNLPAALLEAAIALSIVFLGVEVVRARRGKTSLAIRQPWIVAIVFGLLHGFGFAGALAEAGFPQGDVPFALLAFNFGVETGQLAFVVVCRAKI